MNTYECWVAGLPEHKTIINAETLGKAKSKYFDLNRDIWTFLAVRGRKIKPVANLEAEKSQAQWLCDNWNEKYPVGTNIRFHDAIELFETVTASEAWVASCQPLVLLEGKRGGYSLENIQLVDEPRDYNYGRRMPTQKGKSNG